MAPTVAELVDPAHTVVVAQECQRGVLGVGSDAIFPALAEAAAAAELPARLGDLATAARAVGVPIVHALAERRLDGRGANTNARLFAAAAQVRVALTPGSDAAAPIPQLGPEPDDLLLRRLHGIGPMHGTELEAVLRNLGCRTIVAVGVSVNIGLTDLVFDAVNAGFQVVIPRDAVAGVPASYAEDVLEHTLSLLATLTTVAGITEVWAAGTS